MKKISLLLLALICSVATWADATVTWSTPTAMSYTDFVAMAGTSRTFGLQAVSSNTATYKLWFGFTSANSRVSTITTAQEFTLEGTADAAQFKRVSDSQYLSAAGTFGTTAMDVKLVNRTAGDYSSEYTAAMQTSIDNSAGSHYNANSYAFAAGTGGWSAYVAFETYTVASVEFTDEEGNTLATALSNTILCKGVLPSIAGYDLTTDPTDGAGINGNGSFVFKFTKNIASTYAELKATATTAYNKVKGYGDKLITSSCTFDNTCGDSSEGTTPTNLCDDNASTFWHSDWRNKCTENPHWMAITFPEAVSVDDYQLTVVRRSAASDHVTEFTVYGKNTDDTDWTQISVLSLPYSAQGETKTALFNIPTSYTSLKFAATATSSSSKYWHAAELQLQPVIYARKDVPNEADALKTQLDKEITSPTQSDIDALQGALDKYNEALEALRADIVVNLTDAAGNTLTATINGPKGEVPALTGAYGYTLSDETWNEAKTELTAKVTFPFATSNAAEGGTKVATTIQSELGTSKWYAKDGNVIADNEANTTVYESTADNYRWYIFPTLTTDGQFKFKLYNVGAQKYIPNSSAVSTSANTATALADAGGDYSYWHINTGSGFGLTDGSNKFLTVNTSGTNQNISLWTYSSGRGHKGSNLSFPELKVVTKAELKSQVEAMANTTKFELVEGATIISPSEYAAPSAINSAIDAAKAIDTDDEDAMVTFLKSTDASTIKTFQSASKSYGDPLTCNYTATEGWNTIIMPVNFTVPSTWTLYTCAAVEGKVLTLATPEGQNKNTPFIVKSTKAETFQIIGYAGGAATENVTSGLLTGVITSATTSDGYVLSANAKSMKQVVSETEVAQYHCYMLNAETLTEGNYYFDENDVPETVTANMYIRHEIGSATFCAPFEVEIPTDVKAYTADEIVDNSWIRLTEITTGTIQAYTPVVVYCKSETDFTQDFTEVPATGEEEKGLLIGNYTTKVNYVPANSYVLQCNTDEETGKEVAGWYVVESENIIKVGPNRCYMTITNPARSFYGMSFDSETTGINSIATEAATKADGKYLVNGKIVVVKAGKAYNMGGQVVK